MLANYQYALDKRNIPTYNCGIPTKTQRGKEEKTMKEWSDKERARRAKKQQRSDEWWRKASLIISIISLLLIILKEFL